MPTLEDLQSPNHAKLTREALAEIAHAREYWRDQIYQSRDAVESALLAAGHRDASRLWSDALALALKPTAMIDYLVSLAVPTTSAPATSHKPAPARRPQSNSTTGIRGVTKKRGGYQARLVVNKERHNLGTYKTPELAAEAIDKFLAGQP